MSAVALPTDIFFSMLRIAEAMDECELRELVSAVH